MISKKEILENIDTLRDFISVHSEDYKCSELEAKSLAGLLARTVNFTRRKYKIQSGIYITEEIAAMSKATELDKYM